MEEITKEFLWFNHVQFGHQKKVWNPKMKPYIYALKNNIHIIDLQTTINGLEKAVDYLKKIGEKKQKVLFVGTKKSAQKAIQDIAEYTNNYYVNQRWLGGTLTNQKTIHIRIKKLFNMERDLKTGKYNLLIKKERMQFDKKIAKLRKYLTGIKYMRKLPDVLFVSDPKHDIIAVKEAKKLGIKVIATCDTNVDPDLIDFVIPANDDHFKSVEIITKILGNGYCEGAAIKQQSLNKEEFDNKQEEFDNQNNILKNKDKKFKVVINKDSKVIKKNHFIKKDSVLKNTDINNNVQEKPIVSENKINELPTVNFEEKAKPIAKKETSTDIKPKKTTNLKIAKKVVKKTNAGIVINVEKILDGANDIERMKNTLSKLTLIVLKEYAEKINITKLGRKIDIVERLVKTLKIEDNKIISI